MTDDFTPADPAIVDRAAAVLERLHRRRALAEPTDAGASPYRPELPPAPPRIAQLPVHRGYPVPWFVAWVDGLPEFRVADGQKKHQAIAEHRCWVCGTRLGKHLAFLVGPMCAINQISGEPPSHRECAEYAATACPFLVRPHMHRRENDLPDAAREAPGVMLRRNPGVALIWLTRSYQLQREPTGFLFRMGRADMVMAFAEGRRATEDEILESVRSGLPLLIREARRDGERGERALMQQARTAALILGIPPRFDGLEAAPPDQNELPLA